LHNFESANNYFWKTQGTPEHLSLKGLISSLFEFCREIPTNKVWIFSRWFCKRRQWGTLGFTCIHSARLKLITAFSTLLHLVSWHWCGTYGCISSHQGGYTQPTVVSTADYVLHHHSHSCWADLHSTACIQQLLDSNVCLIGGEVKRDKSGSN